MLSLSLFCTHPSLANTQALMLSRLRGMSRVFRRALLSPPFKLLNGQNPGNWKPCWDSGDCLPCCERICFQRGANCTATNYAQGKLNSSVFTENWRNLAVRAFCTVLKEGVCHVHRLKLSGGADNKEGAVNILRITQIHLGNIFKTSLLTDKKILFISTRKKSLH